MHSFLTSFVLVLSLFVQSAVSQESTAAPTTTGNIDISREVLAAKLSPMPLARIEVEVQGWMDLLVATNTKISENKIAELGGSPNADLKSRLIAEQDKAVRGLGAALEAMKALGGDPTNYEKYIAASSGLDLSDASGFMTYATNWVTSEEGGIAVAINLVKFLITLFLFKIAAGIIAGVVRKAVNRMKGSSDLLRDFLVNVVRRITFFIGLIVALSMLNVDITPFVAALGAAGFVIGFALQGTLSNFASGIMILIYRPYDIGEVVTAAGTTGKVDAMTLVSTTLRLPDNQTVIVPNNSIWGDVITNVTGQSTRRVDMTFGCGYTDDLQKTQVLLEEIVKAHPKVHVEPEPVVKVHELADSSVNFVVRPWADTADYWDVFWDVTRAVKDRFDAEGISIPFPQQDVHVHQVTAGTA
jgi:small conductance mechanosensitive channel